MAIIAAASTIVAALGAQIIAQFLTQ